jgi:hypothetical protein
MYDGGMLAELATAIENLEIPCDGDSLAGAISLRDRLDARIVRATAEFEASGWWGADGSVSTVAWLRAHARMTKRSAQRLRTLAVRMRSLPVCAQAYSEGLLSAGQVDAIVARLNDELVEVFATQEAQLVPYLIPLTVAGVSRAMAAWLLRNQPEPTEAAEPDRSLHLSRTIDDRWAVDGWLDAEGGSVVAAALRLATPTRSDISPGIPLHSGPMPSSTSVGSFSTISRTTPAAGTGRMSTSWLSSMTWSRDVVATWSTDRHSMDQRCPDSSVTAPCTGS